MYYWPTDISPANVEQHIMYAKAGGFKLLMISVSAFTKNDFGWIANHPPVFWENDSKGVHADQIEYSASKAA